MKQKKIYSLVHYEKAERDIYLLRGIEYYSTYRKAQEDKERYKKKKGFRSFPNNFIIREITVNQTSKIKFMKVR